MAVVKLKLAEADAATLSENLIVYNRGKEKWSIPARSEVQVSEGHVFEQFTRHPARKILPAGAFSYVVEASTDFFFMDIGRYCSIARGTRIVNGNHPLHSVTTNPYHYGDFFKAHLPEEMKYRGPVEPFPRSYGRGKIGNDVWLGAHCIIRSGISIGDGAVIASGSVVVKDVPPYTIVGGNPAKPIRERFPREIIDRFLALQWWNYSPVSFRDLDMYDVESFLTAMEKRKESGDLLRFEPNRFTFKSGKLVRL